MRPVIAEKRHIISTVCVSGGEKQDQRAGIAIGERILIRGGLRFDEISDKHLKKGGHGVSGRKRGGG